MGLDVTAYSKLKAERTGVDRDDDYDGVMFYANPDFAERCSGIDEKTVYSYADSESFRAGSYIGYNAWRNQLAKLAGFKDANDAWSQTSGPFWELINFSDCEGTIAGDVTRKLLADFVSHQEKADAIGGYFAETYADFRRAFALAADGGAVDFH